jgi:cytochrome c oxidase subunit 2
MFLGVLVWLLSFATVALFAIRRWWFPDAINDLARSFDSNFVLTAIVTGIIFLAAHLALGYGIVRFRDRGAPVRDFHPSTRLELGWTIAGTVLFVGLAAISARIWAGVHMTAPSPSALRVEVLAKQFAWSFRYTGPDGKLGRTAVKLINDANGNPFGIDEADPAAKDDIVTSTIRVPADTPILLTLRSRDVIHNFFVRELRIKQDAVPGMEIPLPFIADKPGTYEIACSELCGLGHHQMRSTLVVMTREDFDQWQNQMLEQLRQQQ